MASLLNGIKRWCERSIKKFKHSVERLIESSIGRSIQRWIERSIEHSIESSIDHSMENSIERSIDRSIERPIECSSVRIQIGQGWGLGSDIGLRMQNGFRH